MNVKTVTVVGANGTMGKNISAIFASFGNAKVFMVSRDIKKSKSAIEKTCQSVRAESIKRNLLPVDYSKLEQCVVESDIVFESVAENKDIKVATTTKIADIASKHMEQCLNTVFCTGTSGLSITHMAELYPEELRSNYMGMHFFNPPYTMTLCEMTPTKYSNRALFESVMQYCRDVLYRTVVEVKDSPAFLGNRIGFQFINEAMQYAEKYKSNGGIDYIDAILGRFTGRNMAPLTTANFVGLDVHKAIVDNIYENTIDFAHDEFILPDFVQKLINKGDLGRKTGAGLYRTIIHDSGAKIQQVYDIENGRYRNVMNYTFPFIEFMLDRLKEGDYESAGSILIKNRSREAEICVYFLLKYILYALKMTEIVGYNIHAADDVMATGFKWCPPLALIQAFGGVDTFENLCRERLDRYLLNCINLKHLLLRVEPSRYDYRKFIKAKR